jgi:hypothetical protein
MSLKINWQLLMAQHSTLIRDRVNTLIATLLLPDIIAS